MTIGTLKMTVVGYHRHMKKKEIRKRTIITTARDY